MNSIVGRQDDQFKGNGSTHEAASLAHEHLLLLTDRLSVEVEEQRRITSQMMDEKLRAIKEETHDRLRRMKDEMQAQMESRLDSQREATQVLLSKSGENTRLLLQNHRKGIEDRMEAQHRGFEERLNAVTLSPPTRPEQEQALLDSGPPRAQQQEHAEQPGTPGRLDAGAESMTDEAAERLEAFRLLEWRVAELIKRERAAFRNATSSIVLALQQDRADREDMENRLEQTAEACRKAAHDTRAALDLGLADHASMVRGLREELGRRGVMTPRGHTAEGRERTWSPGGALEMGEEDCGGLNGARPARHHSAGGGSGEVRPNSNGLRIPRSPEENRVIVV